MVLKDFLLNSMVMDLRVIRGLGIIPTRSEIEIMKDDKRFILEIESNFRIIYKDSLLLCFNDLFLDKNYKEMSIRKYRSQKDIEKTLLFRNLNLYKNKIINKKIKNVIVSKYGDINITLSNYCKIHIINDIHLYDSSILRINTKDRTEQFTSNNGKSFMIPKTVFEMKNDIDKLKILELKK